MNETRRFHKLLGRGSSTFIIILAILAVILLPMPIRSVGASAAQTSLAVDGAVEGTCPNTTSSCSTSLSTSHGSDIIIVFAMENLNLQISCVFQVSDSSGLSWLARSGVVFDPTGRAQVQEFWARALNALSLDTITESISGCGNNYNKLIVFGVTGANLNTPFDSNMALPGTSLGYGGNTSVQVSTSNPSDLIYAAVLHEGIGSFTPQPGFSILSPPSPTEAVESGIFNTTVTTFSVTFSDTAVDNWVSLADAVQAQSLLPPPALSLSVSVTTGAIYFPGDTANLFIIVTRNGRPTTISDLQLTLLIIIPAGSVKSLSVTAVQRGVYSASFAIPSTTALGTYAVILNAFSTTAGDSSAITSFVVKPAWIAPRATTPTAGSILVGFLGSHAMALTAGATWVSLVSIIGVAWQEGYFKKMLTEESNRRSMEWNNTPRKPE